MSTPPPKGPESGDGLPQRRLDAAKLLMQWRDTEITAAQRRYRRLSIEEVEEVYDETVEALLDRLHEDAGHLVKALMIGLRMRCLNKLRDRKRRERREERVAPAFYEQAQERSWESDPERALLAAEDNIVIGECIAGLTPRERQVFALKANGFAFRGIGDALGIDRKVARKLERAVDRKRDVFLKLYETGRLCGYRSRTIETLLAGGETGELAVREAVTHLKSCRKCERTHKITHKELRARFDEGALALLPPVILHSHSTPIDRSLAVLERALRWIDRVTPGGGGARERVLEATAGGAAAAKSATVLAGVLAVLATGVGVGVHEALQAHPSRHAGSAKRQAGGGSPRARVPSLVGESADGLVSPFGGLRPAVARKRSSGLVGPGRVVSHTSPGISLPDQSVSSGSAERVYKDAATGSPDVPFKRVTGPAPAGAHLASDTGSQPGEPGKPVVPQQRGGAFTP